MNPLLYEVILWACVGAVAYNYVGYPCVLFALAVFTQAKSDLLFLFGHRRRRCQLPESAPRVAVLVSAYNEEKVILSKITNLQNLNYPPDCMEILIGLDAPTDATARLLQQVESPRFRIFQFPIRRGKLAVLRDLAQRTSAEILVFTDANTMFDRDCVRNLVRHFTDPQVGVVSGEEVRTTRPGAHRSAEVVSSRYETALRFLESRLNCALGAYGAVYAMRHNLFEPDKFSFVEDFKIPTQVRFNRYRVIYDPEAIAREEIPPMLADQFERRIRLSTGSYETLFGNPQFLNPLKGLPAFAYFSHRVLRWLTPLFLFLALVCNLWIASRPLYASLLAAQIVFYGIAVMGYLQNKDSRSTGLLSMPCHFVAANLASVLGFWRYIGGRQSAAWKVTPRGVPAEMQGHDA